MTTPHPNQDINCRCYNHHTDPLFIKLTTDYPGAWTPHKQGYRVKWGKVTAYVYRTGSDEEVCVEMVCFGEQCERKAKELIYLDDAFESCVEATEYYLKLLRDDWIVQLTVFKDCPIKVREYLAPITLDIAPVEQTIAQLKEQLKAEQKTLRQLNKLKGVLGL